MYLATAFLYANPFGHCIWPLHAVVIVIVSWHV